MRRASLVLAALAVVGCRPFDASYDARVAVLTGCDAGVRCGEACVDPSTDATNCGACGVRCATGEVCTGGTCGPPPCGVGLTRCGGSCVSLLDSREHCGRCGRDCGGAASSCVAGQCRPVTLATNFPNVHGLALDDAWLYFACQDFGRPSPVGRVSKTGADLMTYASQEPAAAEVALHQGRLYWTNWDVSVLRSVPLEGGTVRTEFADDAGWSYFGVLSTPAGLVWGSFAGLTDAGVQTTLRRLLSDGGAEVLSRVAGSGITQLGTDGTDVYFTVQRDPGSVRVARADGGTEVLVDGLRSPWGLTVDRGEVFFTELGGGALKAVPTSGGAVRTLAQGLDGPRSVVADGEHLYVVEHSVAGRVLRVDRDGGALLPMATGLNKPSYVKVDAEFVYWSSTGDGRLAKVRK